ncbi:MAG: DUF6158 family protein [Pseudonocardiaceae bacterium]
MQERGLPARELSDEELERQGTQAHLTRNRVFLHGTAEQFRHHTERMLELEQEYLRRYPKRTWQGSENGSGTGSADLSDLNKLAQVRLLFTSFVDQMNVLLADDAAEQPPAEPGDRARQLLALFADTDGGAMNKLEAHQRARELGLGPAEVASLYKHQPPLLATAGPDRVITDAGRAWLRQA